jgi:hypothetical protein
MISSMDSKTRGGRPLPRSIAALVAGVCGFIALAVLGAIFAYPAAAAGACPSCYGFENLEPQVFLQNGASTTEKARVAEVVAEARDRVRSFYGSLEASPRILICDTEPCYRRFGGVSRGQTIMDAVIFLSPRGIDPIIASHEISHNQIHRRIGFVHSLLGDVPEWFVEGVAVVVSDDPRYLTPASAADRCLVEPDGPLPTTLAVWIENAGPQQLYAKSACQVARWRALRAGSKAVVRILSDVAGSAAFGDAYRQL